MSTAKSSVNAPNNYEFGMFGCNSCGYTQTMVRSLDTDTLALLCPKCSAKNSLWAKILFGLKVDEKDPFWVFDPQ